jgi:hypothetical protein
MGVQPQGDQAGGLGFGQRGHVAIRGDQQAVPVPLGVRPRRAPPDAGRQQAAGAVAGGNQAGEQDASGLKLLPCGAQQLGTQVPGHHQGDRAGHGATLPAQRISSRQINAR